MKRARNVAQAAWTSQSLRISSWSCIGPRRRQTTASISASVSSRSDETMTRPSALRDDEAADPFMAPNKTVMEGSTSIMTVAGIEEISELEVDEDERMTEVELWQQLESELCRERDEGEEEEAYVSRVIREEEEVAAAAAAAAEEVKTGASSSLLPVGTTKEVHRFFPPGRIIHIVTFLPKEHAHEGTVEEAACSIIDAEFEHGKPGIGVFETPRSLYGKLRLSQAMINDHYMPVYRRNMEKLISELAMEDSSEEFQNKDRML